LFGDMTQYLVSSIHSALLAGEHAGQRLSPNLILDQ
jgi:hypothetical protein